MNGKRAKSLRRSAEYVSHEPWHDAQYEKTNEHIVTEQVGVKFDSAGNEHPHTMHTTAHTTVLAEECGKKMYRLMKRIFRSSHRPSMAIIVRSIVSRGIV